MKNFSSGKSLGSHPWYSFFSWIIILRFDLFWMYTLIFGCITKICWWYSEYFEKEKRYSNFVIYIVYLQLWHPIWERWLFATCFSFPRDSHDPEWFPRPYTSILLMGKVIYLWGRFPSDSQAIPETLYLLWGWFFSS